MWTRKRLIPLAVCLVIAVGLIILLNRHSEPHYNGRSLSGWYVLWNKSVEHDDPQSQAQAQEAAQAIKAIGTNAIPALLEQLRSRPSAIQIRLGAVAEKLSAFFAENKIARTILYSKKAVHPESIFVILGPQGSPAIPELSVLLRATNIHPEISRSAAWCLAAIGKEGLPPLLDALAHAEPRGSMFAAHMLSIVPLNGANFDLGTSLAQAVPLLAKNALSEDTDLAQTSIRALGHLQSQPQIAIPALTNSLSSPDPFCRLYAVRALARFGIEAVPALHNALESSDVNVRMQASNHLRFLAPALLINAPAQ
jgi:HEAT repeat protein